MILRRKGNGRKFQKKKKCGANRNKNKALLFKHHLGKKIGTPEKKKNGGTIFPSKLDWTTFALGKNPSKK